MSVGSHGSLHAIVRGTSSPYPGHPYRHRENEMPSEKWRGEPTPIMSQASRVRLRTGALHMRACYPPNSNAAFPNINVRSNKNTRTAAKQVTHPEGVLNGGGGGIGDADDESPPAPPCPRFPSGVAGKGLAVVGEDMMLSLVSPFSDDCFCTFVLFPDFSKTRGPTVSCGRSRFLAASAFPLPLYPSS